MHIACRFGRFDMVQHSVLRSVDQVVGSVVDHVAEIVCVFDQAGVLRWTNAAFERELGLDSAWYVGRHAIELAHPDDIALGVELLTSAKATGAGVKEPVTYRLRRSDGTWLDAQCVASNVQLETGELVLVVTARPGIARPATAIVSEASQRVSAMFDQSLIAMAQLDLRGRVLRANPRLATMLDASDDLLGADLGNCLHGGELGRLLTGASGDNATVEFRTASGRRVVVQASATLILSHVGAPLYYAFQAVDVTELHRLHEELARSVHELSAAQDELRDRTRRDPLTGLFNRHGIQHWCTERSVAWAAYIDLDDFKTINDHYGHRVGDEVLMAVADKLRALLSDTDAAGRIGGDEFVVIAGTNLAPDRLATNLDGILPTTRGAIDVNACIGIAYAEAGEHLDELLDRADTALYRAKRADPSARSIRPIDVTEERLERAACSTVAMGSSKR